MHRMKIIVLILFVFLSVTGFFFKSDDEKKADHYNKGKVFIEEGDLKSAELELRNAIQIDPEYADAYLLLGETLLKLGNAQEAFQAYGKVEQLDPENIDVRLRLASFLLLAKQTDMAKERLDAVLAIAPENTDALMMMAAVQEQEKNLDEAASLYEKVMGVDAGIINAYVGLARVRAQPGQRTGSGTNTQDMPLISIPNNTSAPLSLVSFYIATKRPEKAEEDTSKNY